METAIDHYVKHLGPVYCWMVGDLHAASLRAVAELDALGLAREAPGIAVDLGAGFGLYALPLAQRGYQVTAIDSCRILLDELQLHAQGAGFGIPSQFMSAMPYLATVIVLVLISRARTGGSTAPAALGTVFVPDR